MSSKVFECLVFLSYFVLFCASETLISVKGSLLKSGPERGGRGYNEWRGSKSEDGNKNGINQQQTKFHSWACRNFISQVVVFSRGDFHLEDYLDYSAWFISLICLFLCVLFIGRPGMNLGPGWLVQNHICLNIQQIYPPGADKLCQGFDIFITINCDFLPYNYYILSMNLYLPFFHIPLWRKEWKATIPKFINVFLLLFQQSSFGAGSGASGSDASQAAGGGPGGGAVGGGGVTPTGAGGAHHPGPGSQAPPQLSTFADVLAADVLASTYGLGDPYPGSGDTIGHTHVGAGHHHPGSQQPQDGSENGSEQLLQLSRYDQPLSKPVRLQGKKLKRGFPR